MAPQLQNDLQGISGCSGYWRHNGCIPARHSCLLLPLALQALPSITHKAARQRSVRATNLPARRLSSVLFPAFGGPTSATLTPSRTSSPRLPAHTQVARYVTQSEHCGAQSLRLGKLLRWLCAGASPFLRWPSSSCLRVTAAGRTSAATPLSMSLSSPKSMTASTCARQLSNVLRHASYRCLWTPPVCCSACQFPAEQPVGNSPLWHSASDATWTR